MCSSSTAATTATPTFCWSRPAPAWPRPDFRHRRRAARVHSAHHFAFPTTTWAPSEELCRTSRQAVAAVIVEPVAANMGLFLPPRGFSTACEPSTRAERRLLIFDEVITGFRVAWGGAQARFGIEPDLTTLGKIIGGGLPVGAYGGRRDLMDLLAPGSRVSGRHAFGQPGGHGRGHRRARSGWEPRGSTRSCVRGRRILPPAVDVPEPRSSSAAGLRNALYTLFLYGKTRHRLRVGQGQPYPRTPPASSDHCSTRAC